MNTSAIAQDVFVTPSGEKYHLESCRHVNNVSKKLTIADAAYKGYSACKVCRPPYRNSSNQLTHTPNKAVGSCSKTRCLAIAKTTRNQCKRITSLCNSFCFQHNPDK